MLLVPTVDSIIIRWEPLRDSIAKFGNNKRAEQLVMCKYLLSVFIMQIFSVNTKQ